MNCLLNDVIALLRMGVREGWDEKERMKELIDGCRNRKQGRVRVVSERKKRE